MFAAEKITKNTPKRLRAWVKKTTARKSRRLGKLLLEDAPRRVTKGWAD